MELEWGWSGAANALLSVEGYDDVSLSEKNIRRLYKVFHGISTYAPLDRCVYYAIAVKMVKWSKKKEGQKSGRSTLGAKKDTQGIPFELIRPGSVVQLAISLAKPHEKALMESWLQGPDAQQRAIVSLLNLGRIVATATWDELLGLFNFLDNPLVSHRPKFFCFSFAHCRSEVQRRLLEKSSDAQLTEIRSSLLNDGRL